MADTKGSWDRTEEAMESQGGGTFLRLDSDGDKAVVAFCGPPFHRDLCFNEKTKTYEAWDDAAKAAGRRKSSRYAMNVYVTTVKGKPLGEMRVLEMNFNTMTTVIGLRDKYTLGKYLFEVTRHGAAGDTKTTYQILPDREITDADRALFGTPVPGDRNAWTEGSVALIDLEAATAKDEAGGGDAAVADDVKKDTAKKTARETGKGAQAGANAPATTAATNGTNGTATAATASATPTAGAATAGAAAGAAPLISKEAVAVIIAKLKPLDREKGVGPFLAKFPYAQKVSEVRASDETAAVAYANQLAASPAAEDPFT